MATYVIKDSEGAVTNIIEYDGIATYALADGFTLSIASQEDIDFWNEANQEPAP